MLFRLAELFRISIAVHNTGLAGVVGVAVAAAVYETELAEFTGVVVVVATAAAVVVFTYWLCYILRSVNLVLVSTAFQNM